MRAQHSTWACDMGSPRHNDPRDCVHARQPGGIREEVTPSSPKRTRKRMSVRMSNHRISQSAHPRRVAAREAVPLPDG